MSTCLAVFCGSSEGVDPRYVATTHDLGRRCADAGIEVVCGGARVGLMGVIARSTAAAGGRVCGVLPRFLAELEPPAPELTNLITVETMHERKAAIAERADAFLVLPGGLGTLEEAFEIMTLRQLREHSKNVVFVNIGGYYDPLVKMFVSMEERGFFVLEGRKTLQVADDLDSAWSLLGLQ